MADLPEPVAPTTVDEAALLHDDVGQHRRQAEAFEARDVARDVTDDDGDAVALPEDIDAEVAHVAPAEGEVHLPGALEALDLLGRHHLVGHAVDHCRVHGLLVDGQGVSVDLDVDRSADGNEGCQAFFSASRANSLSMIISQLRR